MTTDSAMPEPVTAHGEQIPPPIPGDVSSEQPPEPNGYPPAPSGRACAALVPCRDASQGCPLGVDIPAVTLALAGGDHEGAFRTVRAAHPFASTCGTACYAPCESACRRRPFGAPVAIAALEEHASAFATPTLGAPDGPCTSRFEARSVAGAVGRSTEAAVSAARSGRTIAIVGAGAAGLACAHDLALLGHRSVVFDAHVEPGGLMTRGIPPFRFPVTSARAECAAVLRLDVEFRGAVTIGGLRALLDAGIDAVFLAIGASRAAPMLESLPQHPDILDAMDVLSSDIVPLGQTIVTGESALAIDAARTLARRRLAAENGPSTVVQVLLTAPVEASGVPPELLAACARDEVRIHHGWRASGVHIDSASGLLVSIDIAAPDGSSRQVLACDRLVLAASRVPATTFAGEIDLTRSGFIATDPHTLRTSMPNVWAGGACAFGHRSIAHAVADGKRAAWEIHASFTGARVASTLTTAWVEANGRPKPDRDPADRRRPLPLLEPPPADPFAPSSSRAAARAGAEAARCFDCARLPAVTGECTGCRRCAESCPTGAITLLERRPVIDGEICHRCGTCIDACPEAALTMLRAEWEERILFAQPNGSQGHYY
jgi:formate dehydrogenase beta subunit